LKVLFDSNVHISNAVFGGAAGRAVRTTLEARWKIFVCETILKEVSRIVQDKFGRSKSFASTTVQTLRSIAEIANEPASRHLVPGDPNDAPILRAAIGAGVDYLVTGDKALLALDPIEGVRIVNLTDFLVVLRNEGLLGRQS